MVLKKAVEGSLEEKDEVLIVDDVTTTGGSIETAAEEIREEGGGTVNHATVMLDREEGAKKTLEKRKVQLHSCLKISESIEYLKEEALMEEKEYSLVKDYLE